jgi:hypothetical protein
MSESNLPPRRDRPQPLRGSDDETDYQHRNFINLVAAIAVLAIAIGVVWAVKAIETQEDLNRCFESGRRDCVTIEAPPRETIRLPDH